MKKLLASAAAITLLAGQGMAAMAQTAPLQRESAPVTDSEGAIGTVPLVAIFLAAAVGIVLLVEEEESDLDLPTSP